MARSNSVGASSRADADHKGTDHTPKARPGLVIAEDDETASSSHRTETDADGSTEYSTDDGETSESRVAGQSESEQASDDGEDEDEDDEDDEEDDEEGEDDDDDEEDDEEEEEEEDDDDDDDDGDGAEDSDASSAHTTTTPRRGAADAGLSSAAIREALHARRAHGPDGPVDLEAAILEAAATVRPDPIAPSIGAPSLLDPEEVLQNPFSETAATPQPKRKVPPPPSALGARQMAASQKAERINDSEYDLILAQMVAQNRKLNQDPKAMRRSALGIGKLSESFERLQQRKQARSVAEAEGLGTGSTEFGIGVLKDSDADGAEEDKIDWEFWGGLIKDYNTVLSTSPIELSKAIYTGIPSVLRGMLWQLLSGSKDEDLEAQYAKYLSLPCPLEREIRRDLSRTFPSQEYFQDAKGVGQENLFNVVKAYSLFDPECGYCQGMQFIVGPLLLNMPDEEAFCTLVRLMQNYDLRGHYIPNMPSLQLRLFQFDRLVEETLPVLHLHMARRGIKSSMYASQWFMTSYRFPLDVVYRILDSILAEGIEAMFRFALALLEKNEDRLLKLDFEECVNFLKLHLIDVYTVRGRNASLTLQNEVAQGGDIRISELVTDAFQVKISPHTLDTYANEFFEQVKSANERQVEMDALRVVNRNLQLKVQSLEEQLSHLSTEHVDLVKRVVMAKLSQEEMAEDLVRYKVMYVDAQPRGTQLTSRYAEAVLQNEVSGQP
ncbi:GTPase-activating protein [Malassezia sp. CBS 17886]|nr:GTPase-activating protein [Malassezia sp. CBS 17886]